MVMWLTHWLLELFAKNAFFFLIMKIFSLEMDQTSSDLIKKAFATWQHSFPSTSTTFYNIFAQAYAGVDGLKKHKGQLSDSPLIINTEFTGFSNWKRVAGGNWKVAGALSHRDYNNGSLVEWGSTPTPSAERNMELPLGKFWKSGCLD